MATTDVRFLPAIIKHALKQGLKRTVRAFGYEITRKSTAAPQPTVYPRDFLPEHIAIMNRVGPFTLTSPERIYSLIEAVSYVVRAGIQGSIVECGVWRGGSMMAAALRLLEMGCEDRDLYLFDTFQGMTRPQAIDVHVLGQAAINEFEREQLGDDSSAVCYASLSEVRKNLALTQYDPSRAHFIQGKVEETIPGQAPDSIALLRLDTDWYESTRHELEHLYHRLSPGGILIIDDYGDWQGAKRATDEFIATHAPSLMLSRIDDTGRIAVKP